MMHRQKVLEPQITRITPIFKINVHEPLYYYLHVPCTTIIPSQRRLRGFRANESNKLFTFSVVHRLNLVDSRPSFLPDPHRVVRVFRGPIVWLFGVGGK